MGILSWIHWGFIGIVENTMEIITMGYLGFRGAWGSVEGVDRDV